MTTHLIMSYIQKYLTPVTSWIRNDSPFEFTAVVQLVLFEDIVSFTALFQRTTHDNNDNQCTHNRLMQTLN